jgi:ABC-type lipoprotein release transport system permease subunit
VYRSFLSWRYLVSRPTNLIGIVGILVGVGALILILSIMTGFLEMTRRTVRGTLADLIVMPRQGEEGVAGKVGRDPLPLLTALRADARVAAAAPQLLWGGIITQRGRAAKNYERLLADQSHSSLLAIQLVGVDVDGFERLAWPGFALVARVLGGCMPPGRVQDELDATAFLHSLVGDRPGVVWTQAAPNPLFPFAPPVPRRFGRPRAGVLVGEQLFSDLALSQGDALEIGTAVFDPKLDDWRLSNREFEIAGTFKTRDNETDSGRIYLDRRELADFLGDTRSYTQVLVRLADYERDADELAPELRASLIAAGLLAGGERFDHGKFELKTWEEFRGFLLAAIENERVLMGIMLSLVLVVAGFTIFAILSMMVTEKRRDVGILAALGATPSGIQQLFLMIAFWDALLGGLLGAVLGTWGALEIDAIELWLSDKFGVQIFNRDVYLFDHIPSVVQPLWVGTIVLGAFVCALLFAAIPAWRAARLDPLQALRYE